MFNSLAYTELYFAIAMIFRKLELELFDTTREDVEVVHDFFMGTAKSGSKGVRARVVRLVA